MNIPLKDVLEVVTSQFEYVKEEMESGVKGDASSFKTILLKYFGTFTFNKPRYNKISDNMKKDGE